MLSVRDVEYIPTELQEVGFAIWHLPRFSQSQVYVDKSGVAEVVARPGLARIGIPEVLINLGQVATTEQIRSSIQGLVGARVNGLQWRDIGLEVPVG